jgi:hypothetical protein
MATRSQPRRVAHILRWELPDGLLVNVHLHQVTVRAWRTDPAYQTGDWHCIPAREPGQVLVARLTHWRGGSPCPTG